VTVFDQIAREACKLGAGPLLTWFLSRMTFAELTRELVNWQVLEGWHVLESQFVNSWRREGEIRGVLLTSRANLLKVVRLRLKDPVPESIRLAVEGTNDPEVLDRWLEAALTATSLAKFRAAMRKKA
jgi:hypothetical protein